MPLQLQYIAPANPTDTPAQVFAQRGPHDLYFHEAEDMARLQEMVKQLPTVAAGAAVAWPILGQVTLPLVELAQDAEDQGYGAVRITTAAWTRFCSAPPLQSMELAGPEAAFESYGKMYETLSDKRRAASEATQDALTLRRTDLEPVQAEVMYDESAGDAAAQRKAAQLNEQQRARQWLNDMPLRTLRGAYGMLSRVAMLACWLGSHISRDSRDASHFCRSIGTLTQAVGQKESINAADLENEEIIDGVATLLATTPTEPMLMEWCVEPGGVKARSEMRKCIGLWLSPSADATAAYAAATLKEKLGTALRMLPAVHAMVGRAAGGQLPIDIGVAYQAITTVAQRVGVCEQGKQLEPATLRELQSRISHLCAMLVVAPWAQRSFQERCDHVVIMLQTAQKREAAASSVQGAHLGQEGESKTTKGGAGAVPKHYQDKVPAAVASAAYIAAKRAILHRLAKGGAAADLDALQIATTGVITGADGVAQPRAWIPLLVMMAEGGKLGVDANLVDPELADLHFLRGWTIYSFSTTWNSCCWRQLQANTTQLD